MLEDGTRPEPFDIREWIFGDGCAGQQAERACHSRDTIQQAPRESGADADAFLKATIQGTKLFVPPPVLHAIPNLRRANHRTQRRKQSWKRAFVLIVSFCSNPPGIVGAACGQTIRRTPGGPESQA